MSIERDPQIRFHEQGTLNAVTRWISTHDEGLAEWLKNVRRAYQADRADVPNELRAAVILLTDATRDLPARIGLLDAGGATLEDVTKWSKWNDPEASSRGSTLPEEETQGNGGKAYMYTMFLGAACILGVRNNRLNCKGFEGPARTLERGIPGFMPDNAHGHDLPIVSWEAHLRETLKLFKLGFEDLPREMQVAISEQEAFTLVRGEQPRNLYKEGRIPAEDLIRKVLRHDQSTLAVQQLRLYAIHNGRILNNGKPLELDTIDPYPGFETPQVFELPEELPDESGKGQSTTEHGKKPKGRVILFTSREDMPRSYKNLKPRWKISYRATTHDMIGSKPVSELVPGIPGSYFIYAAVELESLQPDYVATGRIRPLDGPLMQAVDQFLAERIRALAKEINDQRREDQDEKALDKVHEENRKLDHFKNRFMPSEGIGGQGGVGPRGNGEGPIIVRPPPPPTGETPDTVELAWTGGVLRIGKSVRLHMTHILQPSVRDNEGRVVPRVGLEWHTSDARILELGEGDVAVGRRSGKALIWVQAKGTAIESRRIEVEVWNVDHVLLTPRFLQIPLGRRKQIIAEVTNDEGTRATDVYLNWEHDADDQLVARIQPSGWVTGNRIGRTTVSAGAGDPGSDGVWARIRPEIEVVPNPEKLERGGGFPQLLLTDKDIDPSTGEKRESNPDQPALWQEVWDQINNIWWLNLGSPDAAFAFARQNDAEKLWRMFHAQKVVEMVIQVHMHQEFNKLDQRPDVWVNHKAAWERHQIMMAQAMWKDLQAYVNTGSGLE